MIHVLSEGNDAQYPPWRVALTGPFGRVAWWPLFGPRALVPTVVADVTSALPAPPPPLVGCATAFSFYGCQFPCEAACMGRRERVAWSAWIPTATRTATNRPGIGGVGGVVREARGTERGREREAVVECTLWRKKRHA